MPTDEELERQRQAERDRKTREDQGGTNRSGGTDTDSWDRVHHRDEHRRREGR